jgi:sigma-B regulation protein RsbU (phosphoserine phosphatase)
MNRNVLIIIVAAVLIELFSAVQYYTAHGLVEEQLDYRAENEIRIKAIVIKGILNLQENTLREHLWDIDRNLDNADAMFESMTRIIAHSPHAVGSFIAFRPYYFPQKGRLFEPYAYREGKDIKVTQLGESGEHDYTLHPAYQQVESELKPSWSDPYEYAVDSTVMSMSTYSYPLTDKDGRFVAICGIDLSLQQIGDTLNARHTYPSSFDLLLTESGQIISGPTANHPNAHDVEQVVSLIEDSAVVRKDSHSGRSHVIAFDSEKTGERAYIYFANIKGEPHWQVAVVCYDDEVFGDLYLMRLKGVLFMLLAFGLLGFIIQRSVRSEKRLSQAQARQDLIDNELRIAQSIQNDMLPRAFEAQSEPRDVQICGSLKPAREVGGDVYDYFLRDEKLFFCIGDVSGKGIPSAIIMAEIHSQFRMASMHETNPARIMQTLNVAACEGNETNIFVTLFVGVLDLPTGRLRYCNAGHDVPYLLASTETAGVVPLPVCANIPIGLFDDFKYEMQEVSITPRTTIFLYTDGLTEAKNPAREQFAIGRVEKVLATQIDAEPKALIESVSQEVHRFMENAEQSDDLTMLAIRYTPHHEFASLGEIALTNDVRCVKELNAFVKSITDKVGIEPSQARNIRLAVEEAVVNVIDYAYPIGTSGDITVQAMSDRHKLKFVIIDSGIAFDPTEAAQADTSLSVEDRPIGGLGLLLVRELMDTINYERIDGRNTLTLIKRYNS